MSKCGLSNCKNKKKEYGVCGVHKRYAYESQDVNFKRDLGDFQQNIRDYNNEANRLTEAGYKILEIQSCWNHNLAGPRQKPFPKHLEKFGSLLERSKFLILEMQKKYNNYLVSNATSKASHYICDPQCMCSICLLGREVKVI